MERRIGVFLAAALALVLVLTLEASPAAGATSRACRVRNASTGQAYPRLQQAVKAAKPGARLIVTGTCRGGAFIDKDLVIVGKRTKGTGKPILDGDGKIRVVVIKPKVQVHIRGLVIRDGNAQRVPNGGGIANKGKVTLRDVVVRNSRAKAHGGGIHNEGGLRVLGTSRVKWNTSGAYGNGPAVTNLGRLVIAGSTRIVQNSAPLDNQGTVVMKGTSNISRNTALKVGRTGPTNSGTFIMEDRSSITEGSGFWNTGALTLNDASSIHHNISAGPVTVCGGGSRGGGVVNAGSLVMNDASSIHHNIASGGCSGPPYVSRGGGVYNEGSVAMTSASRITSNEAGAVAGSGEPGLGGGLYNASGATLAGVTCGTNVYGNTPDDCHLE